MDGSQLIVQARLSAATRSLLTRTAPLAGLRVVLDSDEAAGWVDASRERGWRWWGWAAAALVAVAAGAVVRTPGAGGWLPPEDGLGADALYAATPAIADELRSLAAEHGAGTV